MIDPKKCKNCNACISVCPFAAITVVDGKLVIDDKLCIGCMCCSSLCPVGAITIKKK